MPHYYILEYHDPYVRSEGAQRYDRALARPYYRFYENVAKGRMEALRVLPRPGVLAWYYNGAFAWSENDPAINRQGRGFLLPVDAWPNELELPGLRPGAYRLIYSTEDEFGAEFETSKNLVVVGSRRTPLAPFLADSMGKVSSISTSSGARPWASVIIVTVGRLRLGKTSIGNRASRVQ